MIERIRDMMTERSAKHLLDRETATGLYRPHMYAEIGIQCAYCLCSATNIIDRESVSSYQSHSHLSLPAIELYQGRNVAAKIEQVLAVAEQMP